MRTQRPTRLTTILAGLSLALTLVATAACSSGANGTGTGAATGSDSPSATPSKTLSILLSGRSFYDVPLYAMMNDGIAQQNGFNLTQAQFNSGSGSTSQIFAGGTGNILGGGIDVASALGSAQKLDITVLGVWTAKTYFRLVSKVGSKYKSIADLKGQTIGVSGAGSFSDYTVRAALVKAGLKPDVDVKIAALGQPAAQFAALSNGSVQAVMLNPPTITTALDEKQVQTIYNFENDGPMPSALFIARTADVKKDPALYKSFMTAYAQAVSKMHSDPAFAEKVAKEDWGASTPTNILDAELKEFLTKPGVWPTDPTFTQSLYTAGKKMLVQSGKVSASTFPSYQALTAQSPDLSK